MKKSRIRRAFAALVLAGFCTAALAAMQRSDPAAALLQSAIHKQVVDGDLKEAIKMYNEILSKYASNRAVGAEALLHLGEAQEKLLSAEAKKTYQRIVRDFGAQKTVVLEAQARLRAMGETTSTTVIEPEGLKEIATPDRRPWGAITPNGRYLVAGQFGFTVHDLVTGIEKEMEGERQDDAEGWIYDGQIAVSPDGGDVAYAFELLTGADLNFVELRTLRLNGAKGTKPKVLLHKKDIRDIYPFGWSPDNEAVYALITYQNGTNEIGAISVGNSAYRSIRSLDRRWPEKLSLSPDGRYIVYDAPVERDSWKRDIFMIPADGTEEKSIVQNAARDALPVWTPDGNAVIFTSDRGDMLGIWILRISHGVPVGSPELLRGYAGELTPIGFARQGSFFYRTDRPRASDTAEVDWSAVTKRRQFDRELAKSLAALRTVRNPRATSIDDFGREFWIDHDLLPNRKRGIFVVQIDPKTAKVRGNARRLTQALVYGDEMPTFSPDGKFIAFRRTGGGTAFDWIVRSVDSGLERAYPVAADRGTQRAAWLHDGSAIFLRKQNFMQRLDLNTGELLNIGTQIRQANPSAGFRNTLSASPVHKTLYFSAGLVNVGSNDRIVAVDLDTWKQREVFVVPGTSGIRPEVAVTPDGRTLAVVTNRDPTTGVSQLVQVNVDGTGYKVLFAALTLYYPAWSKDGRSILIRSGSGKLGQILKVPASGGKPEFTGLEVEDHFDLSPDGSRIALDGSYRISPTGSR